MRLGMAYGCDIRRDVELTTRMWVCYSIHPVRGSPGRPIAWIPGALCQRLREIVGAENVRMRLED